MLLSKLCKVAAGCMLALVVAVGAGLLLSASQAEGVKPAKERGQTAKAVVPASAHDIAWTYDTNEALGDEKFTGKNIRVTGPMFRVRRALGEKPAYLLEMETESAGGKNVPVLLQFDLKARKQLARVQMWQQVTAEGRCAGRTKVGEQEAILVTDCTLIKVQPTPQMMQPLGGGPGMKPMGPGAGKALPMAPPQGPPVGLPRVPQMGRRAGGGPGRAPVGGPQGGPPQGPPAGQKPGLAPPMGPGGGGGPGLPPLNPPGSQP